MDQPALWGATGRRPSTPTKPEVPPARARGEGMGAAQPIPLTKPELLDLHSILRRAAETAEREKRTEHARRIAEELASIEFEIARAG